MNSDEYLNCVLKSHRMRHVEEQMEAYRIKRDEVKRLLQKEFGSRMYTPRDSGSYAKHTAINTSFDLDMLVPFRKDAFGTLEEMYQDVENFLAEHYRGTTVQVSPQTVSIGLAMYENGHQLSIDVVPGREMQQGGYEADKTLNLYVNKPNRNSLQTNVEKQIEHIRAAATENQHIRNIIRLLKVWKRARNVKLKSFLIELLVIEAFARESEIPKGLWPQLRLILDFIEKEITNIRLIDPGNSNNVVTDTLTTAQKQDIAQTVKALLQNIDADETQLKSYFPENLSFPCEADTAGFGRKAGSSTVLKTQTYG